MDPQVAEGLVLSTLFYNDRPANDHGPLRLGWTAYVQEEWRKGGSLRPAKGAHGRGMTAEAAIADAVKNFHEPYTYRPKTVLPRPAVNLNISIEDLDI